MYNILLTCPPMIKQIPRYEDLLNKYQFKITIPDFQQIMTEDELLDCVRIIKETILAYKA